ncbi:MAG: hypothetical protein JHC31_10250, partial [Sulfurihydrogenibium sp.]|nr:hypothetical protein [Sulfurihydrogenibium sp.]
SFISLPSIAYQPVEIEEESLNITHSNTNLPNILITDNKDEYYKALSSIPTNTNIPYFLGFKELDIDVIYKTSLINNYGLSVRNMLIANTGDKIFPVFMITGREKYSFNLDSIKVAHKSSIDWQSKDFTGYKVVDRLNNKVGVIVSIDEKYLNGFPKWATVLWNNGKVSCEYVIYDEKDTPSVKFVCSRCGSEITNEEKCLSCNAVLWVDAYVNVKCEALEKRCKDLNISFDNDLLFNNRITYHVSHITPKEASPGKRASLQDEYFFVGRLYNVNQKLVSNFLDYKRKEKGLGRKDVIDRLPNGYKYKVEHWFRRDMGGSIPSPKDWMLLKEILDINNYDDYVLSRCLKLQAVKPLRDGKNIGDYLEIEEDRLIEFLRRIIRKR